MGGDTHLIMAPKKPQNSESINVACILHRLCMQLPIRLSVSEIQKMRSQAWKLQNRAINEQSEILVYYQRQLKRQRRERQKRIEDVDSQNDDRSL